jgi:hypothetical protein
VGMSATAADESFAVTGSFFTEGRPVDAVGSSPTFIDGGSAFGSLALGVAVNGSWDCANSFVLNRLNSKLLA